MKRLLSLALAGLLLMSLGACSNAQPEPTLTPGEEVPEILGDAPNRPVAAATPAPEPAEQKEIAAIESLLPGMRFRDMEDKELAALSEQLGGEFEVLGRTDGAGNAYAIIRLKNGKPFSRQDYSQSGEPAYRYICYEVSRGNWDRTLEIAVVTREGGVEREESVCSVRGVEAIDFGDAYGYVVLRAADEKFRAAVLPASRALMLEAAGRGLESVKPDGAFVALTFYDANIRDNLGFGEPVQFYLPLDGEQYKRAEELIGAGFEPKDAKELKRKFPDLYDAGVTLFLDGESYALFSCGAFSLGSAEGYYPTLVSEPLSDWLRGIAAQYLGHDPAAYQSSWFDAPLASATLTFHAREEVDGYMVIKPRTQTITDPEKLEELAELFREAEYGSTSACGYGAELSVTRKDGKALTIYVAEDSCGTAMIMGSVWCKYGEQEELAEIFDEVMANLDD